ncbi:uncharacterized protein LOC132706559 [Cylas formicarius]|uniref:uncharacterized protein LOC132706559 n=1 Tax=Cylas formicarius TaxID=197179 RepID=UPI002958A4F7|nr:uncharacterized protein LOC132706559 [Cylas formicarius]
MKAIILVLLCCLICASANCGCLKCSKHLTSVDVPGPCGCCPLKFIFPTPSRQICGSSYEYEVQTPVVPSPPPPPPGQVYKYKVCQPFEAPCPCKVEQICHKYPLEIQTPVPPPPKPVPVPVHLKYCADRVVLPTRTCKNVKPCNSCDWKPQPVLTPEVFEWVKAVEQSGNYGVPPVAKHGCLLEPLYDHRCYA